MGEISQRERFLNVLFLKPVDRVPVLSVTQTGTLELMKASGAYWPEAHRNAEKMSKLAVIAHRVAGLEAFRIPLGMYAEAEALGCGVDYHEGKSGFTPSVVSPLPDPEKVEVVEPTRGVMGVIIEATKILRSEAGGNIPVIVGVTGPFTLAGYVYGLDNIMRAVITHPESVKKILDIVWRVLADYAAALIDAGADVISLLEPVSSTIGPNFFKEFNLKYLQNITERLRCPAVLHVCGNSLPIIELTIESGVKGLSIEQKVDIGKAKEKAGNRACIIGNLDPVDILLDGKPETVKAESKRIIEQGVDILAPGCGISPYTPTANLQAMVEAVKEY